MSGWGEQKNALPILLRVLNGEMCGVHYGKAVLPSRFLLWVWATARLIASGGQPDALLATQ